MLKKQYNGQVYCYFLLIACKNNASLTIHSQKYLKGIDNFYIRLENQAAIDFKIFLPYLTTGLIYVSAFSNIIT